MLKTSIKVTVAGVIVWAGFQAMDAAPIGFEDIPVAAGSFLNNAPGGVWHSGGARLPNSFTDWGGGFTSWTGFAISAVTGNVLGSGNLQDRNFLPYQFQTIAGSARSGSNFAVGFVSSFGSTAIELPAGMDSPVSIAIANNLYTWAAITHGDAFAKKFGGPDGTDPDFLTLTIKGLDANDVILGSVEVTLADFRDSGNFVLADWLTVDLSVLGSGVRHIDFAMNSSDIGPFGMNTPAYFVMDDLVVIPEPAAWAWTGVFALVVAFWHRRRFQ